MKKVILGKKNSEDIKFTLGKLIKHLRKNYATSVKIEANGFNWDDWKIITKQKGIVVTSKLKDKITVIMKILDVDYMDLNWNGNKFKEFFPIDNLSHLEFLVRQFRIQISSSQYDNNVNEELDDISKLSDEIMLYSTELAEFYDDEDYLTVAYECETVKDLIESLEIQVLTLDSIFSEDISLTEEIYLLYLDFVTNVASLDTIVDENPFSLILVKYEAEIMKDVRDSDIKFVNEVNNFINFSDESMNNALKHLEYYLSKKALGIDLRLIAKDDKFSEWELFTDDIDFKSENVLLKLCDSVRDIMCENEMVFIWKDGKLSYSQTLEEDYYSEDNLELALKKLNSYLGDYYAGSVFTLNYDKGNYTFVCDSVEPISSDGIFDNGISEHYPIIASNLEEMKISDAKLEALIHNFTELSCKSEFTFTWNCDEMEIISGDIYLDKDEIDLESDECEIPYYDKDVNLIVEYNSDDLYVKTVTDDDIIDNSTNIKYDLENDILALIIDDEDLGDLTSINWEQVLDPSSFEGMDESILLEDEKYIDSNSKDDGKRAKVVNNIKLLNFNNHLNIVVKTFNSLSDMHLNNDDKNEFINKNLKKFR